MTLRPAALAQAALASVLLVSPAGSAPAPSGGGPAEPVGTRAAGRRGVDPGSPPEGVGANAFAAFVEALRADATARGVSRRTFDRAFAGATGPDEAVLARTRRQSEFSRPVWEYLVNGVTSARLARGRTKGAALADTLRAVEARYGVPAPMLLAFWGIESDFGASGGDVPTVRALATLGQARYRGDLFRGELLAALTILERGDVAPGRMTGSWAGAMGQVQFLPSTYLAHAVDFDGDGRRDIWASEADALASIAAYLQALGWKAGLSWGYEVRLPEAFDLTRYEDDLAAFARRGVRRTDGRDLPSAGRASLFLPGGFGGPAFLITENFEVVRGYNTSDAYALAVGHLSDRLGGGPALAAPWPTTAARLDAAGLTAVQRGLAAAGTYAGPIDGRAGPRLREAVRRYQIREGLRADGYASPDLLRHLEAAR